MTDRVLEFFGDEQYRDNLNRVSDFWNGKGKCIVSINSSKSLYRQLDDLEEMARLVPENLEDQAKLPGTNMPTFIGDFGTVTTAKYWGGRAYRDSTGENIAIERIAQTVEDALAITPKKVDDPEMDAVKIIKVYRDVCENMKTKNLWLRPGDLQGPLNTASLVMNEEEMLVELYTKPELMHQFLDRITDHLIDYVKYMRKETDNMIGGPIWPWIFQTPEFGFAMTEDMMPLISADLYKQFGIPYVKRMTDEFGPVQIHCCGRWGHQAENLAKSETQIRSVEFWYPHTKAEELEPLVDKGVVLVPYLYLDFCDGKFATQEDYYRHLLKNLPDKYRFWFAFTEETPEAVKFAKEVLK